MHCHGVGCTILFAMGLTSAEGQKVSKLVGNKNLKVIWKFC